MVKYANNGPYLRIQGTIRCLTGPYRPAFFTAHDDDTVGAIIAGSTGSPGGTYAAVALWIDDNVASLRHLRIAWADLAVYYDVDTGWPQELWHTQIAHCAYGVGGGCPEFRVYNALLDHVAINFYVAGAGAPVTARVEHLTSDSATWLNQSGDWLNLCLTNSLLVNVANPGPWTGAGNAVGTAADFNTVLAGRHYLAPGSAHRDAGTEAVDGRLRAELAGLTTEPPARWTEPVTAETVFEPWVARDADAPDRGYHYPPLDFLLSGLVVSGTSLTLTHGVAVGVYGTDGFLLQGERSSPVLASRPFPTGWYTTGWCRKTRRPSTGALPARCCGTPTPPARPPPGCGLPNWSCPGARVRTSTAAPPWAPWSFPTAS